MRDKEHRRNEPTVDTIRKRDVWEKEVYRLLLPQKVRDSECLGITLLTCENQGLYMT